MSAIKRNYVNPLYNPCTTEENQKEFQSTVDAVLEPLKKKPISINEALEVLHEAERQIKEKEIKWS